MRIICMLFLCLSGFVAGSLLAAGEAEGPKPIRALLLTGGCCHDYPYQSKQLIDGSKDRAHIKWTVVQHPSKGTKGKYDLFDNEDWAADFDIIVHNECFAGEVEAEYIRKITEAHKAGVHGVVIHCAMHTFRDAEVDDWRQFLGVTSKHHEHQSQYPVTKVAKDHPIMKHFPDVWTSPKDELYVIMKAWPNMTPLATAKSERDGKVYPAFWVNEYGKARVFGTTFGHGNATFDDDVFIDTVIRGMLWATGKLDAEGDPKPGYGKQASWTDE